MGAAPGHAGVERHDRADPLRDNNLYVGRGAWNPDTKHLTVNELKKDFEGYGRQIPSAYFSTRSMIDRPASFCDEPGRGAARSSGSRDGDQLKSGLGRRCGM